MGSGSEGRIPSFYEQVGGEQTFRRLVAGFYARVATDPALRRLYPEADLSGAEERLRLFLMQYWGGPRACACATSRSPSALGSATHGSGTCAAHSTTSGSTSPRPRSCGTTWYRRRTAW